MNVIETVVEAKMCTFPLESAHFIFNKCPIYTHDGASTKFSSNSHETDYCVGQNEEHVHVTVGKRAIYSKVSKTIDQSPHKTWREHRNLKYLWHELIKYFNFFLLCIPKALEQCFSYGQHSCVM